MDQLTKLSKTAGSPELASAGSNEATLLLVVVPSSSRRPMDLNDYVEYSPKGTDALHLREIVFCGLGEICLILQVVGAHEHHDRPFGPLSSHHCVSPSAPPDRGPSLLLARRSVVIGTRCRDSVVLALHNVKTVAL